MIAVHSSLFGFKEGGSGSVPVVWLPVDQVSKVLEGCVKLRQQLVEDVYQIVGIPDIQRGSTDPQETEGAQQLKSQYAGTRIRDRQQEIARFCRDIGRLTGQVIAEYCSPATIIKMTNMKLPTRADVMLAQFQAQQKAHIIQRLAMLQGPQGVPNGQGQQQGSQLPLPMGNSISSGGLPNGAPGSSVPSYGGNGMGAPNSAAPVNLGPTQEDVFGLLKDSLIRRFKIDIENDSTISGDESQEKQDRLNSSNHHKVYGSVGANGYPEA
jgi:hypothetical protein